MKGTTLVCVLVVLAACLDEIQGKQHKGERCGKERCQAGQTCLENSRGHMECACRQSCPDREHLVCASDGRTFLNHCQLHRAACLERRRLRVAHNGACNNSVADPAPLKEKKAVLEEKAGLEEKGGVEEEKEDAGKEDVKEKKDGGRAEPLVCYQVERDELRQLIVESLYQRSREQGKSFTVIQREKFEACDKNSDGYVDSDELLTCLEKSGGNSGDAAHLHRGLCVDALLTEGSHDDNWMLDFHEFSRLFHPHFRPQTRECELEEKKYKDGSKTKLDCNWCVCACGDWVCTGGQCPDGKQDTAKPDTPVRAGRLPTAGERRRLLEGFQASTQVEVADVQSTVAEQQGRLREDEDVQQQLLELQ